MVHGGMAVFELVLALLLGGVGLALLAPRLGVPWPALLALAGAVLAFVPGMPTVELDPDLALALFVAPVLLDAAYDASPRDLRANWVPVGLLALVVVGLTVGTVAVVARALSPTLPWAAAAALGAVVAPPDASAATAVLRQVRLPHRLMVILEGESLLNDASALLIYRMALGALAGGLTVWTVPVGVLSALAGVGLGYGLARLYLSVAGRVGDGAPSVVLQFLGTFGVWLLADALGLSAVLTVVAYAATLARLAPGRTGARQRRVSYAVWDVAVFVLNILAFILVGLQLRGILDRLDGQAFHYAGFALAVLGTVIGTRIAWVMLSNAVVRWRYRRLGPPPSAPRLMRPTVGTGVVIAWCGMRGIVTLAAALALPPDVPQRDLLVFTAFCVVLGTLVLQGLTLRPLLAWLPLPEDSSVAKELALARSQTARAGLDALGVHRDDPAGRLLAQEYEARLAACDGASRDSTGLAGLRRRGLAAERQRLMQLRAEDRISDDAFHTVEEELDWAEAKLDGQQR